MIVTAFDIDVYEYLLQQGYTHLNLKGIQPVTQTGDRYYYAVPIKKDDPKIADLEWDGLAAPLEGMETRDLLEKFTSTKVMVEWTVAEYAGFLLALNG